MDSLPGASQLGKRPRGYVPEDVAARRRGGDGLARAGESDDEEEGAPRVPQHGTEGAVAAALAAEAQAKAARQEQKEQEQKSKKKASKKSVTFAAEDEDVCSLEAVRRHAASSNARRSAMFATRTRLTHTHLLQEQAQKAAAKRAVQRRGAKGALCNPAARCAASSRASHACLCCRHWRHGPCGRYTGC